MNAKKKRVVVEGLPKEAAVPETTDYLSSNENPNKTKKTTYPIDLYVAFLQHFTKYDSQQAKNILSGLIPTDSLPNDIMRLCIMLKVTDESLTRLQELSSGQSLFKLDDTTMSLLRVN